MLCRCFRQNMHKSGGKSPLRCREVGRSDYHRIAARFANARKALGFGNKLQTPPLACRENVTRKPVYYQRIRPGCNEVTEVTAFSGNV